MVAIRYNPSVYDVGDFSLGQWLSQIPRITDFLDAVISLSAAWVLSRWVYKAAPFRSLSECRIRLRRRNHG
jgi:hypothetical protein